MLQHLLERRFFPSHPLTSASWIRSLTCVSTPLNGVTFSNYIGLIPGKRQRVPGILGVRLFSPAHVLVAGVCSQPDAGRFAVTLSVLVGKNRAFSCHTIELPARV